MAKLRQIKRFLRENFACALFLCLGRGGRWHILIDEAGWKALFQVKRRIPIAEVKTGDARLWRAIATAAHPLWPRRKAGHFSKVLCYNATLYRMMPGPAIEPEAVPDGRSPAAAWNTADCLVPGDYRRADRVHQPVGQLRR